MTPAALRTFCGPLHNPHPRKLFDPVNDIIYNIFKMFTLVLVLHIRKQPNSASLD